MTIFRGKIFYQKQSLYATLIWPIVQLRNLFKWIYNFLLKVIWSELVFAQKVDNEIINISLFFIFIILSLVAYKLRNHMPIILTGFFIIWFFDCWIAKNTSLQNHTIVATLDNFQKDVITWKISLPDGKKIKSEFLAGQVQNISLVQRPVYGGAFQELMGRVWQVELILFDGSDLILDEQKQVIEAVKQAKSLAFYFKVPIIFQSSQGNESYASEPLKLETFNATQTIICRKNQRKWHIYTKWRLKNSWQLLKHIFRESGFLLFVLVMAKFMSSFGQVINGFVLPFLGRESETIYIANILTWFIPELNWKTVTELAIAIIMMIFKGWQLSRQKHIYIDEYYLRFFIDNQKVEQVNTKDIETTLLIKNERPEILILTSDKAISIRKFQQEEELKVFLSQIDAGIKRFQDKL